MRDYRFVLPMMRGVACGQRGWWHPGANERLRAWVLDRIPRRGTAIRPRLLEPGIVDPVGPNSVMEIPWTGA